MESQPTIKFTAKGRRDSILWPIRHNADNMQGCVTDRY